MGFTVLDCLPATTLNRGLNSPMITTSTPITWIPRWVVVKTEPRQWETIVIICPQLLHFRPDCMSFSCYCYTVGS